SLSAFELGCVGMLVSAAILLREDFDALGIPPRTVTEYTLKHQQDMVRQILADVGPDRAAQKRAIRGILNPLGGLGPGIAGLFFPKSGVSRAPRWQRATLKAWAHVARRVDHVLA